MRDNLRRIGKEALLCLMLCLTLLAGPVLADDADLETLVAEALARNPEVMASQARWEALVERVRQAGTFDDPMIMFRAQNLQVNDPLAFDRDNMTAKVIGVSQMLPYFGKRELRKEMADHEAEAGRWLVDERRLELRQMVKETWYGISYVDNALVLVDRTIGALEDLARLTESLYGVGEGLQQDVLKAHLQRSRMEEMRIALKQRRRSQEAQLNTLLFRPADVVVPRLAMPDPAHSDWDGATLERLAWEHRPLLRSLSASQAKAASGRRLADKEFYPDFTLSFEYMQRDPTEMGSEGDDMYTVGVSFNLPVQRTRRHAMVAEADAEVRMAREEIEVERNRIRLGIADTLARIDAGHEQIALFREGLLPQSNQSLTSALAAYRVGKADFMNVLDSQMKLFDTEREYYEVVAMYLMQIARLEGLVGLPALFTDVIAAKTLPTHEERHE